MERKATDVLLDLEEKVDKLLSYIVNMDNNYKIILSRLDALKNATSVALPSSSNKKMEENKIIKNSTAKEDDVVFVENSEPKPIAPNKIRVSQVVKYPKDKAAKQVNAVLASVKVYDSRGKDSGFVVAENRTDQNGRWKIDLEPGEYFVHILKPASTHKPQIDHYFPINIDGEKASLDLEPIG